MYQPLRSRAPRLATAALVLALAAALPAAGQGFDPAKTPATPVPEARWGQLVPGPILADLSGWGFNQTPGSGQTFFHDVDVENGWVFATTGKGLMIWDGRANPSNPTTAGYKFVGTQGGVPTWHQNDTKFYLFGLDAPAGVDSVLGMTGISGNGFLIWNTTDKTSPRVIYQDDSKDGKQVFAATYGGIHYAFFAAGASKVLVYDMSAAMASTASPWCQDISPTSTPCSGGGRSVYAGKVNTVSGANYLHGAGDFLAVSQSFSGVEIWQVSNPRSPQKVVSLTGLGAVNGVAMWKEGNAYYLALSDIVGQVLRILDLSCLASGSCSSTVPQVGSFPLPTSNAADFMFLTFSRQGSTPFLYVGGEDQFLGGVQREFLLDVSNPASPVDITPHTNGDGYWGWYYYGNPTGFNWVMPRRGKFNGDAFYRAAFSLMDVHTFAGQQPPSAQFSWSPAEVYPGTPVTFIDQSTGNVSAWNWAFQDGTPPTAGVKSPGTVAFASAGNKNVTLLVGNGNAPEDSQVGKILTVLAPEPQIASVTVSPAAPQECQPVSFGATGVTGKPPLGYSWQILNNASAVVASGSGTTFTWDTGASPRPPAGNYVASLTVNGTGSANRTQGFALAPETALPGEGAFTPTADAYTAGTVKFHVVASGAIAWNWDFDGDGVFNEGDWTNDPVNGPNPQHTYTTTGTRNVRVKVRNCSNQVGVPSAPLPINISSIIQLDAKFSIFCLGACIFDVGSPIIFTDESTGPPDTWQYDWEGNGSWDTAELNAAVSSHTYNVAGQYRPKLRVRTGASTDEFQFAGTVTVAGSPPPQPSISISGPNSGTVNSGLTFSASARNCTPGGSGWSWSTSGGTIAGSATGSSVTISWSSTGGKTVQATNAGCAGAAGTQNVQINEPGGGNPQPPTLGASFSFSPASPKVGDVVTFNGTGSTGAPDSWFWTLGDGTQKTGGSITHVYGAAGTYQVQLSVSKASSSCPPAPFCESAMTRAVVVGNNEPPPPPPLPALVARFSSASCTNDGSGERCRANVGDTVSFTSDVEGSPTSLGWFFGDGDSSAQVNPTHKFLTDGTFRVTLRLGRAADSAEASAIKDFEIAPRPIGRAAVQPFVAQRSSAPDIPDLVVYSKNAGTQPLKVTIHRPGETQPAVAPLQIPALAAGESRLLPALLGQLHTDGSGTIVVEAGGNDPQPLVAVYQTAGAGAGYGDWMGGTVVPADATGIDTLSHVIGLNDDTGRTTDFGVANAGPRRARFNLRFFDDAGQLLDERNDQELTAFGHLLLDSETLRQRGINGEGDYRVEIETLQGGPLMPFGTSRRLDSKDVSYLPTMKAGAGRQYLMGVAAGAGTNAKAKASKTEWVTDVLLVNPGDADVSVTISFVGTVVKRATNRPASIAQVVHAGDSVRLADVLRARLGVLQGNGMLVIDSAGADGVFPLVLGETYNVKTRRFGQTASAQTNGQLIHAGQTRLLLGLREDGLYRGALSFYNPGGATAKAELVYRSAAGAVLSRVKLDVGAGKLVQRGARDGGALKKSFSGLFSIEVNVTAGDLLVGGQAIRKSTGDASFVPVQPLP